MTCKTNTKAVFHKHNVPDIQDISYYVDAADWSLLAYLFSENSTGSVTKYKNHSGVGTITANANDPLNAVITVLTMQDDGAVSYVQDIQRLNTHSVRFSTVLTIHQQHIYNEPRRNLSRHKGRVRFLEDETKCRLTAAL